MYELCEEYAQNKNVPWYATVGKPTWEQQGVLRNVADMQILSEHILLARFYDAGDEGQGSVTAVHSVLRCKELDKWFIRLFIDLLDTWYAVCLIDWKL
jgi:hypothetical protein